MTAVFNVDEKLSLGGTSYLYVGTLTITSTYVTGGETVNLSDNETFTAVVAQSGVYSHKWDSANQKLLFYYYDYDAVADGAAIQVANGATHTGASGMTCWAIGQ